MAQSSWPFENVDTSETQFSQWARNIGEGIVTDKGLELEPYADSSGMTVKVKSGQALVRGHYYVNDAEVSLTISAADLTNPRKDRIVLRLDPIANAIVLAVVAGTPGATPTAPDLTQTDSETYELAIGTVTVPAAATSIAPENIADERLIFTPWTAAHDAEIQAAIAANAADIATNSAAIADNAADIATNTAAIAGKQNIVSGVSDTEIGYLDGVTSSIQTQLDGKAALRSTWFSKTANYTLTTADNNNVIRANASTAMTVTVPADVFQSGDRVDVVQQGTQPVTFAAGAGLTIYSKNSKVQLTSRYGAVSIMFYSPTIAYLIGDLA